MLEKIKEKIITVKKTMDRSIYVGEKYEKNLKNMVTEAYILMVLGVVMFTINVINGDVLTGLSPLTFIITSIISIFYAKVVKKRVGSVVATVIAILFVFTFDVLFVTNGFAFLWTLLIPLSTCYFLGIKVGIALTAYFQLLYIAVFQTPLRQFVAGHFSDIVLARFPILYFFNAVITIFVMYEYHKSVLYEIDNQKSLKQEISLQKKYAEERAGKLERFSFETVEAFAKTIDAKDRYTNGHSFRVAEYSVELAKRLGFDEKETDTLKQEALLHDIGKIGVPDAVLNKPGRLNDEEYSAIKLHTMIGKEILSGLEDMHSFEEVAMYHHEKYDGNGYPSGLSGEAIPSHARIVALADAYDAMHSDRIYRKARTFGEIVAEIEKERGKQFDPNYADAFLALLKEGALD